MKFFDFSGWISWIGNFGFHVVQIHSGIEVTRSKITTPGDGTTVGHLKNPEACWKLWNRRRCGRGGESARKHLAEGRPPRIDRLAKPGRPPHGRCGHSGEKAGRAPLRSPGKSPPSRLRRKSGVQRGRWFDYSRLVLGSPQFREANCDRTVHNEVKPRSPAKLNPFVINGTSLPHPIP